MMHLERVSHLYGYKPFVNAEKLPDYHWLDDDQPDIPDDDPRWQQLEAHLTAFRDTSNAQFDLKQRNRLKRLVEV
jgi:hypothetical protein